MSWTMKKKIEHDFAPLPTKHPTQKTLPIPKKPPAPKKSPTPNKLFIVDYQDPHNTSKTVFLQVDQFLQLIERYNSLQKQSAPQNVIVTNLLLEGNENSEKCASFNAIFDIIVLNETGWSYIPLLPSHNISILSSQITSKQNESYILCNGHEYIFLASKPGVYQTRIDFTVPYENSQSRELVLGIPKALKNFLKFEVNDPHIQIKVFPSLQIDQKETEKTTCISCSFPSTDQLKMNWTSTSKQLIEEEKTDEEKQELSVVTDHKILHTIGEGIVRTECDISFSIVHGTINEITIEIDTYGKKLDILNVEGYGIAKWQVEKNKVKIYFSYGMENVYELKLLTEMEMGSTSGNIYVPRFACVDHFITREMGVLGVVARANVEIKEEARKYLGVIDVSELPSSLHNQAEEPILYAYKYLELGNQLYLRVTKHEDIPVLCSIIDECNYEVTQADKQLHRISMKIKNTAKQYVRVALPNTKCEVWSAEVNSCTVKPASETTDNRKYILIPLTSKGGKVDFNVIFTFTVPTPIMKGSGNASITFARFDTPVNKMFISTFFPTNFDYGEFEGNLKEIREKQTSSNSLRQFRFARYLMLEEEELKISVPFKEKKKGILERRSIYDIKGTMKLFVYFISIIISLYLIIYVRSLLK